MLFIFGRPNEAIALFIPVLPGVFLGHYDFIYLCSTISPSGLLRKAEFRIRQRFICEVFSQNNAFLQE